MDAGMKIKKEMNGTNGTTNGNNGTTNGTNGYPVNGQSVSNRGLSATIQMQPTLLGNYSPLSVPGACKWHAKLS